MILQNKITTDYCFVQMLTTDYYSKLLQITTATNYIILINTHHDTITAIYYTLQHITTLLLQNIDQILLPIIIFQVLLKHYR